VAPSSGRSGRCSKWREYTGIPAVTQAVLDQAGTP
jgi:hypothetical protein